MDKRKKIQLFSTVLVNCNLKSVFQKTISMNQLKTLCIPGLNCYSCPGALFSCPIGAYQAVLNQGYYPTSFYVLGYLLLFGLLFARAVCGFFCPFGWFQELLYHIPTKKYRHIPGEKIFLQFKYIILLLFVIILPNFPLFTYKFPTYCKFLCPQGTLQGGWFFVIANSEIRNIVSYLFYWKSALLIAIIFSSMLHYRVFCKFLCPLGAFYAFFNKISFFKLHFNENLCISCNRCKNACLMNINPVKSHNDKECVRCLDCVLACPTKAIYTKIS